MTTIKSDLEIVQSRGARAIYCDDIRKEDTGKLIFVGVYGEGLQVEQMPAIIPQFAIYLYIWTPVDSPFKKIITRVMFDDEVLNEVQHDAEKMHAAYSRELEKAAVTSPVLAGQRRFEARQVMRFIPFSIEKEGILKVHVETESEILPAGGMWITQSGKRT